jgi:hypothetical protein
MNNVLNTENKITNLVNDILLLMEVNKHISEREQYSLIHNFEMDNGLKTFFVKRQKITKQIYKILLDIDNENPLVQTIIDELVTQEERATFQRQLNYHLRKVETLLV